MMGKALNTLRWLLVGLMMWCLQRRYGQTGVQAILLQAHDHDTCGFDREATEVWLLREIQNGQADGTRRYNPSERAKANQ